MTFYESIFSCVCRKMKDYIRLEKEKKDRKSKVAVRRPYCII